MRLSKRIVAIGAVQAVLCWIGAMYVRLICKSTKWTVLGRNIPEGFWATDQSFLLCYWHGRILMTPCCWNHDIPANYIVSRHRDGQIISRFARQFGAKPIVGSTGRGGTAALMNIVQTLKDGESVGIAPDGPRGPLMRMSDGIIAMARHSGAPIIPLCISVDRRKVVNSWDRFVFPLPFGRGVILWGEPMYVSPDADDIACETARIELENRLNAVTAECDRLAGVEGMEPGPVRAARAPRGQQ
ncbi:MAG: lysophospholipid acyltransferase family protein [Rhodospirillales bacterium]|nr:lysophospholipid acyltransferase family protein [Rhodospirillales bacterium]